MTEKSMIMNRKRNRKQCMVKRYSCLFTAILITFLILAVSLSICFTVNADQEKPKRHAYKYYTDIVIQKGESLWDIANEHMTEEYDSPKTYIKEVKSINSLTDVDKIYAGQRIVIPYYSTELKQQLFTHAKPYFLCYTVTRIYIIEPAVAMSGCFKNANRIKAREGVIVNIEHTPRGFMVTAEFEE